MPSIALPVSLRGQLLSGSRFNPISLFSAGEQGIWLDPSDLTTMFQDRAGTTPVTTPGQTVGLRLDKSKGLTLGSELRALGSISTAGAPAFVATYSTVTGAGTSYRTDASNTSGVLIDVPDTDGLTLLIDLEVSTGTVQIRTNGPLGTVLETVNTGRTTLRLNNPTANVLCLCSGSNGTGNAFTLHSIRELSGNHAVAPTDAARPTYGIEPKTGRRNLLTRTEEFGDAVWQKITSGVGVAPVLTSGFADPDGTSTAWRLQINAGANGASDYSLIRQSSSSWPDIGTRSIWLRSNTGSNQTVTLVATNVNFRVTVTPTWQRFESASSVGAKQLDVSVGGAGSTGAAADILIWHPQFEDAATATAYQRVGTAFDVTEAGVPTVHYVQYDGTDDSFSTSSIDFTATDKMSVFAGVRKLSDAARAMMMEIGGGGNNGSFAVEAPFGAASPSYAFRSIGTVAAAATNSSAASPISNILTGLGDISAPSSILRLNGSLAGSLTSTQGTGNYGNYTLFIGRRNNTSLPFNGRDYGIIIVGKTASASEIYSTESYLAANTSGVSI